MTQAAPRSSRSGADRPIAQSLLIALFVCLLVGAPGCEERVATTPPQPVSRAGMDPELDRELDARLAAVAAAPFAASTWRSLAVLYQANGMNDLAVATWNETLALDAKDAGAWYLAGCARADQGDFAGAMAGLDQSARLDGAVAAVWWRRGFWLLDEGDTAAARRAFESARVIDPLDPAALVGIARVAMEEENFEEAAGALQLAAPNAPGPYVRFMLGRTMRRLNRVVEADALLSASDGAEPNWRDPWSAELSDARRGYLATIERADGLLAVGRPGEAMTMLDAALRSRPGDAVLLNRLASAQTAAGQSKAAEATLKRVLRSNPGDASAHLNLSINFAAADESDRALAHARKAIEIQPTMGAAHVQEGRLHAAAGDWMAAAAALSQAFRYGIQDPYDRTMFGQVLTEAQRYDDAERQLILVVQFDPEIGLAWAALANVRMLRGNRSGAVDAVRRGLQFAPDDASLKSMAAAISRSGS